MPYKDPDKQREYQKQWMKKEKRNKPAIATPRFFTFRASKLRDKAKNKELDFNIDSKYLSKIWPEDGKCPALKIKMKKGQSNGGGSYDSPSIDRIIPDLGYIKGNIHWVSKLANNIMSSATPDQVIQVGEYFKKIAEGVDNEEKI